MKKQHLHQRSRRNFIRNGTLLAGSFFIVPRHVLGRGFVAPSDKLNIAGIGVGGKGESDLTEMAKSPNVNIVALCDVDDRMAVKSRQNFPNAKYYKDFRVMMKAEKQYIDAVTISTPDHTHAVAALAAMQLGKHVYLQKPLTHNIYEARMLTQAAKKYKVVTQMGNQGASGEGVRKMKELYDAGLIGEAHTIRCWTNRPVWPQGMGRPKAKDEIPVGLDWDLWLGPASFEEYHHGYVPFNWRGYWAFGTGACGDMGCHIIDPAFKVVGLSYPSEVECSVADVYEKMWIPSHYPESCPLSSSVKIKYPGKNGKPDVRLFWMDGGIQPERPEELLPDETMGDWGGGGIIEGTKGKIMFNTYGDNPRLLPTSKMEGLKNKPTIAPVPEGHYIQWVNACIAGYGKHNTLSSSFDYAGPLTEAILVANLALRSWQLKENGQFAGRKKLIWDAQNMRVLNYNAANVFVKREYRTGWELGV